MPVVAQRLGQRLGLGAGAAIDDAGLAPAGGGVAEDLLARLVLDLEGEAQVRPVEAAQEDLGRLAIERARDDLVPGFGIGGGGEGGERHAQRAAQRADAQVIGAEIMAPLADAMRLVHGDQADTGAFQHALGAGRREPFGRDVQELQRPSSSACQTASVSSGRVAGGQRARLDPGLAQPAHLVAHQAMSGEITTVTPSRMSAGSWKHSDLPPPVGMMASTFCPAARRPRSPPGRGGTRRIRRRRIGAPRRPGGSPAWGGPVGFTVYARFAVNVPY
jgi:hypothetical protein